MTWTEFILQCATELAQCHTEAEAKAKLSAIEEELKRDQPPAGLAFWGRVLEEYEKAPKPMLKEATAAAALVALTSRVEALLRARGPKP